MSIAHRHVDAGGYVGPIRPAGDILGFMVHVAEGNNVARYLSGHPARNVSVQYTVEADGEIVSMVPELRVAGSLNPAALRTDDGPYYGRSHLDYVLGKGRAASLTPGPNHWVIAIEVAGKAKDGPNARQIASLGRLFWDCRRRYPHIKPLGHADQQHVKPCPGGTAAMKLAFAAMGGHGKDFKVPKPKPPVVEPPPPIVPPTCAAELVTALDRIDVMQAQIDALEAAITSAIGTLQTAEKGNP